MSSELGPFRGDLREPWDFARMDVFARIGPRPSRPGEV